MSEVVSRRARVYDLLEKRFGNSKSNSLLNGFIVALIISNVIAVILESHKPIAEQFGQFFEYFEYFSVLVFTLEYLARIWVSVEAPDASGRSALVARLRYFLSPMALVDLLAILPFYLSLFLAFDLRYLRLLRMLRLLKITHYFKGLNLFASVLAKESMAIASAVFTMMILVVLSASVMYAVEHTAQPDVFDSIPSAMWWAVVTMTTVGYGDVTPVTFLGKLIAIFIMLMGVGIVALPAAMLAARFGDELQVRKRKLESSVLDALRDGIITTEEKAALETLADRLDLSPEVLAGMVEIQTLEQSTPTHCPHCNKSLQDHVPEERSSN